MKSFNEPIELIIKRPSTILQSKSEQTNLSKNFAKAGIKAEVISANHPVASKAHLAGKAFKTENTNIVLKTNAKDTEVNPWDFAHSALTSLGNEESYIEPNFSNEFVIQRKVNSPANKISAKSFKSGKTDDSVDSDWPPSQNIIWHLEDDFSQLRSARKSVADIDFNVRIGHMDTGYSKKHFVIPESIKKNPLQHNFVRGEKPNDAHDPRTTGFLKQPGHGLGTLGILAGDKINIQTANGIFNDYLGAAYFAEVICCRISESVILFKTNAFADALNYLTQLSLTDEQIHVVSMSMGGAPSKIWADAVNSAYEAGITLVTAAGNNFAGLPTRHVVYPARFGRVIAACGVTYKYEPYWTNDPKEMQGCFGPQNHMHNALSAFTPNIPWASDESGTIRFSGAGTSSVTPQIAAAAAIYYRKYHKELNQLPKKWQRVEAIKNALFKSALKKVNNDYDKDFLKYFGNGIIKANDALKIPVPDPSKLKEAEKDTVPWFPILSTIFKVMPKQQNDPRLEMFNTELAQLVYSHPDLRNLIESDNQELDYDKISTAKWDAFKDAIIENHAASVTLRKYLKENSLNK